MSAISIIIPVHNEERNIPLVFQALTDVFSTRPDMTWDVVFVDDGSRDRSLQVILGKRLLQRLACMSQQGMRLF